MRRYWGQQKPPLGVLANKGHLLSDGLVGCWLMNEGSGNIVQDLSGNGMNGTKTGSPVWDAGKYGPVVNCAAESAGFNCGNNSILDFTTENFTVVMELTASASQTAWGSILNRGLYQKEGWYISTGAGTDEFRFVTNADATNDDETVVGNYLEAGVSHIYTVVREGTQGRMYRDGVEASAYEKQEAIATMDSSADDLFIGRYTVDGIYDFDGKIGFVYIYNRALSASEIQQLYREPFCMFIDDMPVAMMYSYGAAPAPTSQVILIQMSVVPVVFFAGSLFYLNRKKAA